MGVRANFWARWAGSRRCGIWVGAPALVGIYLKYGVYGRAGELLGALGWQSAVRDLGGRAGLGGGELEVSGVWACGRTFGRAGLAVGGAGFGWSRRPWWGRT